MTPQHRPVQTLLKGTWCVTPLQDCSSNECLCVISSSRHARTHSNQDILSSQVIFGRLWRPDELRSCVSVLCRPGSQLWHRLRRRRGPSLYGQWSRCWRPGSKETKVSFLGKSWTLSKALKGTSHLLIYKLEQASIQVRYVRALLWVWCIWLIVVLKRERYFITCRGEYEIKFSSNYSKVTVHFYRWQI